MKYLKQTIRKNRLNTISTGKNKIFEETEESPYCSKMDYECQLNVRGSDTVLSQKKWELQILSVMKSSTHEETIHNHPEFTLHSLIDVMYIDKFKLRIMKNKNEAYGQRV